VTSRPFPTSGKRFSEEEEEEEEEEERKETKGMYLWRWINVLGMCGASHVF
jgi:hypothetical protein